MLTNLAIMKYVETEGDHCPYCKKRNIAAIEHLQPNDTQQVECHDCGKIWREVWQIINIIEED